MMRKQALVILIIALFLCISTAGAQTPPIPERKTHTLDNLQKNLEEEKRRQQRLQGTLKSLKSELDDTRDDLVAVAEEVRRNEEKLTALEQRIEKLTAEEEELTSRLEQDYGSIASLILALERMRRTPTESLIIRPGAPLQTAQSAMLLQSTLPAVHKRANELSADLKRLQDIEKSVREDQASVLTTKEKLDGKYAEMQKLVAKRERLYGRTQADYEQNKKTVARLSREAKTLMDLINKLDRERARQAAAELEKPRRVAYSGKLPEIGKVQLPVTGYIKTAFGQTDAIGARSQGLTIESRPGMMVVAPMGGIVRFAGYFKNYGNMVIIEHKNGYHSLVSGLQKIDTGIEAHIKAGEPVGQLPLNSSRGGNPALYYELRHNGQPVNPASKFSELKS